MCEPLLGPFMLDRSVCLCLPVRIPSLLLFLVIFSIVIYWIYCLNQASLASVSQQVRVTV